tara:strand:+ start:4045 stop:4689 length:645 start_codon:yes stop_codon:yes gene_type:complete
MANLSFSSGSDNGTDNENNLGDNIWYNRGTIKKATDKSGETVTFPNGNTVTYDISCELEVAVPGLDKHKTITISGNFKRDHTGQVIDWGGAFRIQKMFNAAVVTGELNNNRLTPEVLASLIGKEVAFLNYKNTSGKYSSWTRLYPVNAPKEAMKKDFLKDRARIDKGGWINNYDKGDALPNQISNGSTKEAWMNKTDELPQGNLSFDSSNKFMG